MRRIIFLSLIGTLALVTDAFATGLAIGDATQNGTVTITAVPIVEGAAKSNGTGAKAQRAIAIGDEITQLFFGEATTADSVAKSNGSGIATQLKTISDTVQLIPDQQEDTNIGKTIDSLAIPVDSITITAGEVIQQTVKNVDELITQVQPANNNFGGTVTTGDSFIVGEIGNKPPTETTGSKIFQVEQEPIIEKVNPSVMADIFTSTGSAGDGAQGSVIPSIVEIVDSQTTMPSIFVSSEEPGRFQMERQEVLGVQLNPDSSGNDGMKSSFNIPGSAKQIPIFINSKIKHAIFNIHVPASSHSPSVRGFVVDKPNDSSLEIEISRQQLPAIQSTGTPMPDLPQVAQIQDFNLGKSDSSVAVISGGATAGIVPIQQEASSIPDGVSFEIDKIAIGAGVNPTETTPADTFAISGIVTQTDANADQLLLQVQEPAVDFQNVISDERAMRSALASLATRVNPTQQVIGKWVQSPGGRVISGDFDDDNISLEVIGFIPNNNQRGMTNQTVVENQRTLLVKFDDDGSLSTEVLSSINENQTIFLSRPSTMNGNVQTVTVSQVQTAVNGEIDIDLSVEKGDDPTQVTHTPTNAFGNSDEQDDLSLEVNFNLLPKIKRLLRPQLQIKKEKRPEMVFFRHSGEHQDDDTLELNDILANPVFQQKLQEMDERLKSAPAARGKRLMKKYAEALAMSSAAATINFYSFYLPLLIACLLVNWFK